MFSFSPVQHRFPALSLTAARQRGSVVILVMVALVLMAMIGTSYLQVARVQRSQAGQSTGDIDTVVAAVLADIAQTISDDARDDVGNLLATATTDQAQGDEPFDYPWTNVAPGGANDTQVTLLTTAAAGTVTGGHLDNNWLASSAPSGLGTANPYWENISDLNSVFLSTPGGNADLAGLAPGSAPTEDPVTHAGVATPGNSNTTRFTNVRHTLPLPADFADPTASLLIDVDEDGVPDSRWAWATIPVIEGKAYAMGVRIVDLSGRININIATSPMSDQAIYDNETLSAGSADAPRWDTPAEIDFGRFVNETRNAENATAAGTANTADLTLLGTDVVVRHTGTSGVPTLRNDRTTFWNNSASNYLSGTYIADYTDAYTLDDMFEILNQGGANEAAGTSEDFESNGTGLRDFFSGNETSADYQRYLGDKADNIDLQEFFEINGRVHATVLSGTSHLAPSDNTPSANTRINLTPLFDTANTGYATAKTAVSNRVTSVMGGGVPLGLSAAEFGGQFTANIADYVDEDNLVTVEGGRAGLETLPFIAEAYGRGIYNLVSSTPTQSEWSNVGGAIYAIEIANPFQFPIPLSDVYLTVTPPGGPLSLLSTDDLLTIVAPAVMINFNSTNGNTFNDNAATTDINEAELLYPGKSIVFYIDPLGTAMAGDITGFVTAADTLVVDMAGATLLQDWPTDQAVGTPNAPDDFELGLAASTAVGAPLAANYQSVTVSTVPSLLTNTTDVSMPIPGPGQEGFFEARATTAWGGINMLAIGTPDRPDEYPVVPSAAPNSWDFGQAKATPAGYTAINDTQAQVVIPNYDDNQMRHVGELAQVTALGYSATQAVNALWAADHAGNPDADDIYLDVSTGAAKVSAGVDALNVPHAVLLLEQFTIYDDTFTPGTINLNTASQAMLERSLPFSNPTLAAQVAAAIVDFRDNPTGIVRSASSARTTQGVSEGIAYVSELIPVLDEFFTTNGPQGNYAGDTATSAQAGGTDVRVDFGSEYYQSGGAPVNDGVADDREEEILIYRWLSQIATTRSDCFAAYIWVREHEADDFSSITDERRLIGLFVRDETGTARQVGTFQTLP